MKTRILFTGLASNEVNKNHKLCCYKCGREEGSHSLVFVDGERVDKILRIESKKFETDNAHYCIPVCDECDLLEAAELRSIVSILSMAMVSTSYK